MCVRGETIFSGDFSPRPANRCRVLGVVVFRSEAVCALLASLPLLLLSNFSHFLLWVDWTWHHLIKQKARQCGLNLVVSWGATFAHAGIASIPEKAKAPLGRGFLF